MAITAAVRTHLLTLSAVIALTTRIRPDSLAQADRLNDAISIEVNEDRPPETLDRDGGGEAMVVIKSISTEKTKAQAIAEAVKTNGTDPSTGMDGCQATASGIDFDSAFEYATETFAPLENGSEKGFYSIDSVYSVWYRDA